MCNRCVFVYVLVFLFMSCFRVVIVSVIVLDAFVVTCCHTLL